MGKSFEELGREADLALRNVANAKQTVIQAGSGIIERISVEIRGADWENGLFHLREHLTAVVRDRLEELLPAAVARMEQQSREGVEALRLVLQGSEQPEGDDQRQVPRLDPDKLARVPAALDAAATGRPLRAIDAFEQAIQEDRADERNRLPDQARVAAAGTGFTDPEQKAEHDASAAATPPAGSAYAAGSAAPSGPTGRQEAVGTIRLQPADFVGSWKLDSAASGPGFETSREEAELFEQVLVGTKVPARGPVANRLISSGVLEKSDKSTQAVLRLTDMGRHWVAMIARSKATE